MTNSIVQSKITSDDVIDWLTDGEPELHLYVVVLLLSLKEPLMGDLMKEIHEPASKYMFQMYVENLLASGKTLDTSNHESSFEDYFLKYTQDIIQQAIDMGYL